MLSDIYCKQADQIYCNIKMVFAWHSGLQLLLMFVLKLVLLAAILIFVYFFHPSWLILAWKWYRIYRAGLKKHHLKITNELQISYLERKSEPNSQVLLFIHGFTGDKEIYSDLAHYLPRKFHVILIDLPGHGESKPDDDKADYRPTSQVDYVHEFIKAYGFGDKKLCIIGSSMGGGIAGVYAAKYGDEMLSSVVVVCPAGINSPEMSEFLKKSRDDMRKNKDENMLLPRNAGEFKEMMKMVMYHDIQIPSHIADVFVQLKLLKLQVYKKVMIDMTNEGYVFDDVLEKIQTPLLCVWGEDDKILHVSASEVIKQRVKNAEVHVLDRCGHAITLDRPRKFVKILTQFLEKVETT